MKNALFLGLIVLASLASGCASIGPMVNNISYDAGGALLVEKCNIHTNFFWGTMDVRDCQTHSIKIK